MDFALSDIAFSDVGLHVAGSLAAFIVVDFYKSVFSRDRSRRRSQDSALTRANAGDERSSSSKQPQAAEQAQRGWLSLLVGWLLLFVFKFALKATLALLAAALAIEWFTRHVDLAVAYRLTTETAEIVLGGAFFLVMVLVWWILPIRLFKR